MEFASERIILFIQYILLKEAKSSWTTLEGLSEPTAWIITLDRILLMFSGFACLCTLSNNSFSSFSNGITIFSNLPLIKSSHHFLNIYWSNESFKFFRGPLLTCLKEEELQPFLWVHGYWNTMLWGNSVTILWIAKTPNWISSFSPVSQLSFNPG